MKTEAEIREMLIIAARNADWLQVIGNGGPPCFHLEDERFCLRAQRWDGHSRPSFHKFVSLADLMADLGPGMKTQNEIRDCIRVLKSFDVNELHYHDIRALEWVLGEYPPAPKPRPETPAPDPNIVQPMSPGDFPVRGFAGMRRPIPTIMVGEKPNKEGE